MAARDFRLARELGATSYPTVLCIHRYHSSIDGEVECDRFANAAARTANSNDLSIESVEMHRCFLCSVALYNNINVSATALVTWR